jgi:hypothetical protein
MEAPHDTHNFIISMGSQAGITAMLTAILIILIPMLLVLKRLNKFPLKEKFKTLEFSILLGFTAWSIHSFMDINFQIPGTTATAIILCIIMTKTNTLIYCQKKISIVLKSIFFLPISLVVILPGFYRLRGEYYLSKLSNICYSQFSFSNSANVNISEIEKVLKAAIKAVPYSPFPWAVFGDFAIKNNMNEEAELCFINAIRLSPKRASFYYSLAIVQLRNGKIGLAIKNIKMAAKLFPYKYDASYEKMKDNYYKGL